jgi:hypothetical protein
MTKKKKRKRKKSGLFLAMILRCKEGRIKSKKEKAEKKKKDFLDEDY